MNEAEAERGLLSLVIGYQLRHSRVGRNLSQAEVAQGIGSQSMISLLESGRQFPPPDVLRLIAERLDDETLLSYAQMLSSGQWSVMDIVSTNYELLVEVLRAHRGRWHPVHLKIALELCEHFYYRRIFTIVSELCQLILEHSTDEVGHEKAYYYCGSAFLFCYDYEQAEYWLRRADERHELLDDASLGRLQYNLGYTYCELDTYGAAIWYAKLAVDTFHHINDYQRYGKSLGLLGAIQARLGRTQEARDNLQRAYDMLERWGMNEADRSRIAVSLADVCESSGDWSTAETWCLRAIESGSRSSDFVSVCAAYQTLFLVYSASGRTSDATAAVYSAMSAAEESQDGRSLFQVNLLASGVLPDRSERLRVAQLAYLIAKQSKHHVEQALAADCVASLLDQTDNSLATNYRDEAIRLYREHLGRNIMSSSAFQYLPFGHSYES